MTPKFIPYFSNLNIPTNGVFLVGLSHKFGKNGDVLDAFCYSTQSGKIISDVIISSQKQDFIYKMNLVSGVPVNEKGKIRYPDTYEKETGLKDLIDKIVLFKPKIVFLFGKQVSDFVIEKVELEKMCDNEYKYGETIVIFASHPSYIAVYKRKNVGDYISFITKKIDIYF